MISALPPANLVDLGDGVTDLIAHISAATARLHSMIGEFDERGGWCEAGVLSMQHWLQVRSGQTPANAREMVRVARALRSLPQTYAAFSRGEVNESAVRTITRGATAENEDILLHFARYGTGSHLAKICRYYRQVLATLSPDDQKVFGRYLRFRYDDDGSLLVTGRFPAHEGELIRQAFNAVIDRVKAEEKKKAPEPVPAPEPEPEPTTPPPLDFDVDPEFLAMTEVDVEPKWEPEDVPSAPVTRLLCAEGGGFERRNADALVTLAETLLASPDLTRANPDKYMVMLHVDIQTLRGQATEKAMCELARGIPIRPEIVRMIACDASVVPMIDDENGNPLYMGRRRRLINTPLRRALESRDRTCGYPECLVQRNTHGHHIEPWFGVGETELPNLVRLCPVHHMKFHDGEFTIESPRLHVFVFRDRRGRVIGRDRVTVEHDDIERANAHLGIDWETCRPEYDGGRCDYFVAIDHLLIRRERARSPDTS